MENQDQDSHFRELIQAAGPEEPHAEFTQQVMARVQQEVSEEAALATLLQRHGGHVPSPLFTAKILAGLQPAPIAAAAKPIVSRKVWYGIAASLLILLTWSFLAPAPDAKPAFLPQLSSYFPAGSQLTSRWMAIPQPFLLTIIGLAALLLIDYFLRSPRVLTNKTARL